MDFKKLANRAKSELDKRGGTDKLKELGDKAKQELDKRGGTEGLKTSAKSVVDAAKTGGTPAEKAKAAAAAAKEAVAAPADAPADAPASGATEPVSPSTGGTPTQSAGGSLPTNGNPDEEIPGGTSSDPRP